ncbi:hypothetical protein ACMD2_18407 [Ananas comosus]|uniref:Protein FAR1-RELATED SEQUENCE n=1 Tax=Ananas comosus TaxID=4615 RepID=A0A199W1K6_ANACO|nr:hypothetical protein ACMD2_18407 [Ananas comosus]
MTHNQYEREDMEDFMTKDGEPTLWSDDPIEKDARRIYTRILFSEFKTQLRAMTGYKLIELEKESLYKISPISCSSSSIQHAHTYMVTVVKSENIISCTCKLWTKNAKKGTSSSSLEMSGGSSFCRSRRFDSLTLEAKKFIFEGSKSLKAYETACQIIRTGIDALISVNQTLENEVETIKEPSNDLHRIVISQSSRVKQFTSDNMIKDPPHSQCKGRRKPQRLKPQIEKKAKIPRTCKACGKKGHNIRTCKEESLYAQLC